MRVSALARITRENGNGEIKMKRDAYVQNGRPFIARSVAVHSPFATLFFKRVPVVRIEGETFFDAYRIYNACHYLFTLARYLFYDDRHYA